MNTLGLGATRRAVVDNIVHAFGDLVQPNDVMLDDTKVGVLTQPTEGMGRKLMNGDEILARKAGELTQYGEATGAGCLVWPKLAFDIGTLTLKNELLTQERQLDVMRQSFADFLRFLPGKLREAVTSGKNQRTR